MSDKNALAKHIGTGAVYATGVAAGSWLYVPLLTALGTAAFGLVVYVALAYLFDCAQDIFK
jgi:hypothetical protein